MRTLFDRFYTHSIWLQAFGVTLFATVAADLLTFFFYSIFFSDRLMLDLILTAIITVTIAYPVSYVFLSKTAMVARLAVELDKAATTDFLTGLRNRRDFMQAAQDRINGTTSSAGAVLFVDVDHFKRINDQFGHAEGDRILVLVAEAIRSSVRDEDIAARVGGEEFAIFMPNADLPAARRASERIWLNCRLIARGSDRGGITTTVSIGLSMHRPHQSLDDLLKEADSLLYKAKKAGRDQVVHTLPHEVVA